MATALDSLGRPLRDLRISVTDRCNLRCSYCMPKEVYGSDFAFLPAEQLLSFEEIVRLAGLFAARGVTKIRLTGGEPLLRRDLEHLVGMLARIPGVDDLALTTNGTALAPRARALREAGLDRVTVSLDALDEEVFRSMSDARVPLARVLDGIDAASDAGLCPVKVNMVVRRGVNDHCVAAMAEHFRHRPEIVRFVEYMDVGATNGWRAGDVVPAAEILGAIAARWPLEPLAPSTRGEVATRWCYRDGAGEIGVIHSVSQPFCHACTRARLSADGRLYTCLFASHGHDLRGPLRDGADDRALARAIDGIWTARADRYSAERSLASSTGEERSPGSPNSAPKVEMSYIGG